MSEVEVRKIPKKNIIIIVILILVAIAGFLLITLSKDAKMEEVLSSFGYKNIKNIKVYNVTPVEDKVTRKPSKLYKIGFYNNETNQECFGLINEHNGKFKENIECK
jgi:hypothetical protein